MRWIRDNGLTIALLAAFLVSIVGMGISGWSAHNEVLSSHGALPLGLGQYLFSGDFVSATFENWESEFLQMGAYVMLTAFLFQRGSAESRDPDDADEAERLSRPLRSSPGLGRLGHILYSYSLGIAFALLFLASFWLHLAGSLAKANDEALLHGEPAQTLGQHLGDAGFWFESFQNWQSEFLSTAVLVALSIVLRFRGSPESKPVNAANAETGH